MLLFSSKIFGQISLEHTYPSQESASDYFYTVKLSSGNKLGLIRRVSSNLEITEGKITLYNSDHSIYKSISIPLYVPTKGKLQIIYAYHISDQLFKMDEKLEYLASFQT